MKTTSYRGTYTAKGSIGPLNSKICSIGIPLTEANFFKSILLHRNWRGGGKLLLKNGWLRLQTMLLPWPDLPTLS